MGVSWTKDQQKAIDSYGRGVTVSAAAGSGKTAVLIERIIRLLTDKKKNIPADKLLAVTFTIDAAAQMRDKLAAAFAKKLSESPDDPWLLKQQDLVQLARISTIDSFCFDMVKENLNQFEFVGGLKILADAERDIIFSSAFEQATEELCNNDPVEYELLDNYFSIEGGDLEEAIKELHGHLRSICHVDKWIKETSERYHSDSFFEEIYSASFDRFERLLRQAKSRLEDARYCYNYKIKSGKDTYEFKNAAGTIAHNMGACEDIYNSCELACSHRSSEGFNKLESGGYKQMRISTKLPEDVINMFTEVRDRFKADIYAVREILTEGSKGLELSREHLKANLVQADAVFKALCRLEKRVDEVSYDIKLEKNAVDFNDIELMTKHLLVKETEDGFERTELAEEIRSGGYYKIIMIDEYQDVNDIQEIIFKAVSDTDDLSIMGSNTFIVGDMKQAIYGFRKTNPELFNTCIEQAKRPELKTLEHIRFKKNFRSRPEVLDISNFIFGTLMSRGCGQVDYNEDERLELGASYTERPCPAEIMLVNEPDEKDADKIPEEFYQTAIRIRELIDNGAPVCENGTDRRCKQSDFCILVNTNDNIRDVAKALSTVGLQAFCEDTEGYIRSREISLALDMLRIVDNPMNDIALAAVMMSPIMNFTPDEMAQVRQRCRIPDSRRMNHIYQVLTGAAREPDTDVKYAKYVDMGDDILQNKCREAFELVESLRFCSMSMSLEKLVRRIFDVTDLMGLTSLYLDSAKKRANLRLLLQYAGDYERSGNEGVTGFLRFIDSVSGNDKAFKNAVSVSAGNDSVNVKTYHKSKGLEYPFVFLCTLSKKLIRKDGRREKLKLHKSLGCAFELRDRRLNVKRVDLYEKFLSDVLEQEQKSERMRLFYVGCTRAKEKLFLVCSSEKTGRITSDRLMESLREAVKASANSDPVRSEIVNEQETALAWTVMALAKMPKRLFLEEWLEMPLDTVPVSLDALDISYEYNLCESRVQNTEETEKDGLSDVISSDPGLVLQLRRKYDFCYDSPERFLPAKLTVTEIVSAEKTKLLGDKDPEFFPNLPRLSDELDKLTAAERGTYTHKFMELADYEKAYESIRTELERLRSCGRMTEREARGVYVERLEAFVRSDFFERMRRSSDLRREQKFLASVKDLKLTDELKDYTTADGYIQGIADCIFKEDDGWVLVDYKTDNFRSTEDMKKYGTQLMLYKAAFELLLGERVKSSYIYSFKLGEGLEFAI